MAFNVKPYDSYTDKYFKNPYNFSSGRVNSDVSQLMLDAMNRQREALQVPNKRSLLDRGFDSLLTSNYMVAGAVDGMVRDDKTVWEGISGGWKAGLGGVLGDGYEEGETTFSNVLESAGWQPESMAGKFAKGAVGFGLDVLLDPTTYLTGGASALIKGTGRVGKTAEQLAKLGDDYALTQFDKVKSDLVNKGINPDLAERFAMKQFDEGKLKPKGDITHMTDEIAEGIVRAQNITRGLDVADDVLKSDAKKFASEYNRLMGIRGIDGSDPITFGIANFPFLGNKEWAKKATVKLSDGDKVRALSDKLGISNQYQKLRANIYGKKIGELFSTNAPLWRLAQENPAKLYDFVKFIEVTKGLHKGKVEADKIIRDRAKSYNFTPSEGEEIIKLLEDKTIWNSVKKELKFADTREASEYKKVMTQALTRNQSEYNDLISKRDTVERVRAHQVEEYTKKRAELEAQGLDATDEIAKHEKALEQLDIDYRDSLANMNLNLIKDKDEMVKVVDTIKEELNRIDARMADVEKNSGIEIQKLDEMYGESMQEQLKEDEHWKLFNKMSEQLKQVRERQNEAKQGSSPTGDTREVGYKNEALQKELQDEYDRLGREIEDMEKSGKSSIMKWVEKDGKKVLSPYNPRNERFKIQKQMDENKISKGVRPSNTVKDNKQVGESVETVDDAIISAMEREMDELKMQKPGVDKRHSFIDHLSERIYGKTGKLSPRLKGKAIEDLLNMIKDGADNLTIQAFIEKNAVVYSPHASEVFSYIAGKLGYKDWGARYGEPMKKLQDLVKKNGNLSPEQMQQMLALQNLKSQRDIMFNDLFSKMSHQEFKDFKRKEANAKELGELYDEINDRLNPHEKLLLREYDVYADRVPNANAVPDKTRRPLTASEMNAEMVADVTQFYMTSQMRNARKGDPSAIRNFNTLQPAMVNALQGEIQATADAMTEMMKQLFPDVPYDKLSEKQKNFLIGKSKEYMKAPEKVTKETKQLQEVAQQEFQRRTELARIEAVIDNVKEGSRVSFKDGRPREGVVTRVSTADEGTQYTVKTRTGEFEVRARDVKFVREGKENFTPDELVMKSDVAQSIMKEKEATLQQLEKAESELKGIKNTIANNKRQATRQYNKSVNEYKSTIESLEEARKGYDEVIQNLRESEDAIKLMEAQDLSYIDKVKSQIDEFERILADDDALEAWARVSTHSDLELLKDPDRYSRNIKYVESTPNGSPAEINLETGEIFIQDKKWTPEEVFDYFGKYMQKRLADDGWDKERIMKSLSNDPDNGIRHILEHELNHRKHRTQDMNVSQTLPNGKPNPAFYDMEVRAHREALRMLENLNVDEAIAHAQKKYEDVFSIKDFLSDVASSDKVAKTVEELHNLFTVMGEKEVGIGKMSREAFEAMIGRYVPHILSPEGKRHVESLKELQPHKASLTQDFGYGQVWNPYSKSRTVDKTIAEANKYFEDKLKIKGFFQENIADIYLARAIRHEEVMYDNHYMKTMMDMFGSPIKNGVVEKGHKAVVNYGQFRDKLRQLVMEDAKFAKTRGVDVDESWYDKATNRRLKELGLDPRVLDDFKTPMIELTQDQVVKMQKLGITRQVNDAIVMKANQARKLAIARSENRLLHMYDKFLHFMKLNQTTIMPSFHMRNKMSNIYLNWLGVGKDAVNPKLQWDALRVAHYRGNPDKIKDMKPIVSNDGTKVFHWNDIYQLALQHHVIDEGFFAKDIGAGAGSYGLLKKVPGKFDPTDTENFAPYKWGAEVGNRIENSDRLVHFVSMLKQGKSVDEAGRSSKEFLFDYSDLTAFEQSVMKRIFPYYTWLRKNGRLQVSQLLEQPGKYRDTAKVMSGIENSNNREDQVSDAYLSDFAKDWVQMPFGAFNEKGEREPILLNPNLPFMDIGRLPDPSQPLSSARELLAQTAPQIKVPLELMSNKNFFFNDEIVKEGESLPFEWGKHLAGQFALNNAIGDGTKDGVDLGLHTMANLTGVKMLSYDYETSKQMKIAEYLERLKGE